MALWGRALALLLAASWASGAAADSASSQGLNASNDSSLDVVPSGEVAASGSAALGTDASEMGRRPVNASAAEAAVLLRPAATNDTQESMKEAVAQEIRLSTPARSKDLNASKESSGLQTIVASVSADGMVSEEPEGNDTSEHFVEDEDYELVAEYDEDELEDAADNSEAVAAEAPSGRKRSSMVRSERLSPGDFSLGFPSSVLANTADAMRNSTMSEMSTEAKSLSLLKDFRTLFVLLFLLCLPMVAVLVGANLCMGLDVPKPGPLSVSKFPHPAGLDAVRRRPLVT